MYPIQQEAYYFHMYLQEAYYLHMYLYSVYFLCSSDDVVVYTSTVLLGEQASIHQIPGSRWPRSKPSNQEINKVQDGTETLFFSLALSLNEFECTIDLRKQYGKK